MDAVEFLKEKDRMCDLFRNGNTTCEKCKLSFRNNSKDLTCNIFVSRYPQEAVKIVEKWSEEHPKKTLLQDFLEKYPNAKIESDGTPEFCPSALGYKSCYSCDIYSDDFVMCDCKECWGTYID